MELASHKVPFKEAIIAPVGDLQFGAEACDIDRFKRHIDELMKMDNVWFIGMGDYVDVASPSNRQAISEMRVAGRIYDSMDEMFDEAAHRHLDTIKAILKPTIGKWLGLVTGHHKWEFRDGTTSDTLLCQYLKAPFLGDSAFVRMQFELPKEYKWKNPEITIWLAHGMGSGQTQASPITLLENRVVKGFEADIYLIAHQHKKVHAEMQRLYPDWRAQDLTQKGHKLKFKRVIMMCTGGYLKGYMAHSSKNEVPAGGYVEKALMSPVALGGSIIYAKPWASKGDGGVHLRVGEL